MAAVPLPSKLFAFAGALRRFEIEVVPTIGSPRGRVGIVVNRVPMGDRITVAISNDDVQDHESTEGDVLVRDIVHSVFQLVAPESDAERIRVFEAIRDWLCERRGDASLDDHDV